MRERDKIMREKLSHAVHKFHVTIASFKISINEELNLNIILILFVFY